MEQGTMSWTFHPPLRCKNRPDLDARYASDVMKVPRNPSDVSDPGEELHDFDNELEVSAIVRQLDPDQHYFLPLSGDACEIADDIADQQFGDDDTLRVGYFLPYGGKTLLAALEEATPEDAWNWLYHLLEGIELLESADIQHRDLHLQNIVISEEDWLPRIIDFGGTGYLGEIGNYGNLDVTTLLNNFKNEVLPILRRRFPNNQSLSELLTFVDNYFARPVLVSVLLARLQ